MDKLLDYYYQFNFQSHIIILDFYNINFAKVTLRQDHFANDNGHCYLFSINIPQILGINASDSLKTASKLLLYENNTLLGPAHAIHQHIRKTGHGKYSHWGSQILFSTSDNSDPNTNGRIYTATLPISYASHAFTYFILLLIFIRFLYRKQIESVINGIIEPKSRD